MSHLFDVYPRYNIAIERANGHHVYDAEGQEYLDFYGGHGVISIGHSHPTYVNALQKQLQKIGFYSNSIEMPEQELLAKNLAEISGYNDYKLFLCNSGAEANENALKLASFHTSKKKIIAFKGSFHGRTAAALNVTDNIKLSAEINIGNFPVEFIELNNTEQLKTALAKNDVAALIVEGIQGVGGLDMPTTAFLQEAKTLCKASGALLILDEIQSGYGRSGKFFAHQHANIEADIVSMAKGMGNGFPIGGILISPEIKASSGLLGTTFGGNHLACAAGLSVLEVLENENVLAGIEVLEQLFKKELSNLPGIVEIKGQGLMLGLKFEGPIAQLRKDLLFKHHIFTGASADANLIRILPPLTIGAKEIKQFSDAIKQALK